MQVCLLAAAALVLLVPAASASLLPRTSPIGSTDADPCVAFANGTRSFNISSLFKWPVSVAGTGADQRPYSFLWSCRGDIPCGYLGNASAAEIAAAPNASVCQACGRPAGPRTRPRTHASVWPQQLITLAQSTQHNTQHVGAGTFIYERGTKVIAHMRQVDKELGHHFIAGSGPGLWFADYNYGFQRAGHADSDFRILYADAGSLRTTHVTFHVTAAGEPTIKPVSESPHTCQRTGS